MGGGRAAGMAGALGLREPRLPPTPPRLPAGASRCSLRPLGLAGSVLRPRGRPRSPLPSAPPPPLTPPTAVPGPGVSLLVSVRSGPPSRCRSTSAPPGSLSPPPEGRTPVMTGNSVCGCPIPAWGVHPMVTLPHGRCPSQGLLEVVHTLRAHAAVRQTARASARREDTCHSSLLTARPPPTRLSPWRGGHSRDGGARAGAGGPHLQRSGPCDVLWRGWRGRGRRRGRCRWDPGSSGCVLLGPGDAGRG